MAKTAIKVDQKLLTQAINEAEKDGACRNLNDLWQVAAKIYNSFTYLARDAGLKEISHSIVMLRVEDWKIPHETVKGKKGRQKGWRKSVSAPASTPVSVAAPVEVVVEDVEDDDEPLIPASKEPAVYQSPVYVPTPLIPSAVKSEPMVFDPEVPNEAGQFTADQVYREACNVRSDALAADRSSIFEAWSTAVQKRLESDAGFLEEVIRDGFGGFKHVDFKVILDVLQSAGRIAESVPEDIEDEDEVQEIEETMEKMEVQGLVEEVA